MGVLSVCSTGSEQLCTKLWGPSTPAVHLQQQQEPRGRAWHQPALAPVAPPFKPGSQLALMLATHPLRSPSPRPPNHTSIKRQTSSPRGAHSRCAHDGLDQSVLSVAQLQAAVVAAQHAARGPRLVPAAAENQPVDGQARERARRRSRTLELCQEGGQALDGGPGVPARQPGGLAGRHHGGSPRGQGQQRRSQQGRDAGNNTGPRAGAVPASPGCPSQPGRGPRARSLPPHLNIRNSSTSMKAIQVCRWPRCRHLQRQGRPPRRGPTAWARAVRGRGGRDCLAALQTARRQPAAPQQTPAGRGSGSQAAAGKQEAGGGRLAELVAAGEQAAELAALTGRKHRAGACQRGAGTQQSAGTQQCRRQYSPAATVGGGKAAAVGA